VINTNAWNRLRYTFWAPVYDRLIGAFEGIRAESIRRLDLRPGERVLLVGAGTGVDLPHLPPGCPVLATDLTPAMLERARARRREGMQLALMDGHALGVGTGAVDALILHLVLAVLPDPVRCLREAARVLRPGGRIAVLDKFARSPHPSLALRLVNSFMRILFTEMTRHLPGIVEASGAPLVIERDDPAFLGGLYRYILLRKKEGIK
jgi:ubiquinone/menaquinone biosynthesis C-methylase UbiE